MKTAEEIYYDQFGRKPTWDELFVIKEYAKQLLEEYTNRIVENVTITNDYGSSGELFDCVDKESITSQLPQFLKEIGYE